MVRYARRKLQLSVSNANALDAYNACKPCTRLEPVSSATGNAFGMMIFYAIQALLSFLIYGGMSFFSRYLPTEVPKLNCCLRLYGGLVRFFMDIQIKLHYVTFV